jgi:hypothetical protein
MPVQRDDWRGSLSPRSDPDEVVVIERALDPSRGEGGSGPFPALDSEGRKWWVKPANNLHDRPQGTDQQGKLIVTEYVVGSLCSLIGAPCCEVAIVRIPEELADFEFTAGRKVEPGLAHGSLAIEDTTEIRSLEHRQEDDNQRRHAGVFALYDWCWGSDDQWLYVHTDEQKLYSHDHGHYLPGGPNWIESALIQHVDQVHQPGYSPDGLDPDALDEFASRLENVDMQELREILNSVPASYPVEDEELEALGYFLERRAPEVADRLRLLRQA